MGQLPDLCPHCGTFVRLGWKTECGECHQPLIDVPEPADDSDREAAGPTPEPPDAPVFANTQQTSVGLVIVGAMAALFMTVVAVAVVCVGAVTFIGGQAKDKFEATGAAISTEAPPAEYCSEVRDFEYVQSRALTSTIQNAPTDRLNGAAARDWAANLEEDSTAAANSAAEVGRVAPAESARFWKLTEKYDRSFASGSKQLTSSELDELSTRLTSEQTYVSNNCGVNLTLGGLLAEQG